MIVDVCGGNWMMDPAEFVLLVSAAAILLMFSCFSIGNALCHICFCDLECEAIHITTFPITILTFMCKLSPDEMYE